MGAAPIDYVVKVAVYLGAAYLFYRALLRNDANFLGNRLFLLLMLPLSFLLPLAPLRSPFRSLSVSPAALATAAALPEAGMPPAAPSISPLTVLYWAGVALFTLRILFHLLHLYRLQRRHPRERRRHVVLVRVGAPIPPFSFFNRIFLHTAQHVDAREVEQIISHEWVHIRQLHSLDILVMEVAVALQWFNPLVWLYRKALKETHEYLADREVIAQGFSADGYRLLLFEQQFGAKLFELASHLKQSQIRRRMSMMNRMNRAGKVPYKIVLALPLIAFLALALAEPRLVLGEDKKEVAQKEEQAAMSEQKLKDTQLKLETMEKDFQERLAASENPVEQQKLRAALDEVRKKRQLLMTGHVLIAKEEARLVKKLDKRNLEELLVKFEQKEKVLKELYNGTADPEKKEQIKRDLEMFYKKRQEALAAIGVVKMKMAVNPGRAELEKKLQVVHEEHLKLEQVIAAEKNPEKLKELKLKLEELARFEEELKIQLEEGAAKRP